MLAITAWAAPPIDAPADDAIVVEGVRVPVEGTGAAVTSVEVDASGGETLADVVERVPGVHVQRFGGLGAWSSVGLRGADLRQTAVSVDGVLLNPDGGGASNLTELPVGAFDQVDVWRGGSPLGVGAPVGGLIALRSRSGEIAEVDVGGGSWGTVRVSGAFGAPIREGGAFASVELLQSDAAYPYFDDRSTPYNLADDRVRPRANSDVRQLGWHAHAASGGPVRLAVVGSGVEREQGLPGHAARTSSHARYAVSRQLVGVSASKAGEFSWEARAQGLRRVETLSDPLGEVGLVAQERVDRSVVYGAGGEVRHVDGPLRWAVASDLRVLRAASDEQLTQRFEPDPAGRWVLDSGASVGLIKGSSRVSATVQGLVLRAKGGATSATQAFVAPRLGVSHWLGRSWMLRAQAGRAVRAPDLVELFGDRGVIVGRPDLRPERAWMADAGVVAIAESEAVAFRWEGAVFARRVTDRIVYLSNAQHVAVPVNLGGSQALGLELGASLETEPVSTVTTGTVQRTVNRDPNPAYFGNQLPRVPALELHHSTALHLGPVDVGHRFHFIDGTWSDATNWLRAAPRVLNDVWVQARISPSVSVELDAKNALDHTAQVVARNPLDPADTARVIQPLTDFVGYPLPGRTVMLTLRLEAPETQP